VWAWSYCDRKIEVPADIVMAIGKEEPAIQLK